MTQQPTQRRALLIFSASLLALFVVIAISEGIGDPSIPYDDVALVEDAPAEIGEISAAEFEHAIELAAAQASEEKPPKPGDPQYGELTDTAMKSTLEGIWIQGLANQWGIEATDEEVARELEKVKKESFPSKGDFKKFLKESRYTPADVNERVKIQILSGRLQEQLKEKVPKPSQSEVEDYYEAARPTQFTQKPSRDVRLIVNRDRGKAEEARDAVSTGTSVNSSAEKVAKAKRWKKVAKRYSEDVATKESGGLQRGLQDGVIEEPLNAAIFGASEGEIEGPIKAPRGYTVFEVVTVTPESVSELKPVESQIESTLAQRLEQEYFTSFVAEFRDEWTQRTFCASDYVTKYCANFAGDGRPATAPEACYEADPRGGRPKACPAPVFQLVPALPGSVTPLEPKGKPLAQRPRPSDEGPAEEAPLSAP